MSQNAAADSGPPTPVAAVVRSDEDAGRLNNASNARIWTILIVLVVFTEVIPVQYAMVGLILPKIEDHLLRTYGWDSDRDPTVVHPSELAHDDLCLLAVYRRITLGQWPPEKEDFDFVRENIFAEGNVKHELWQNRMRAAGFPLWGDWSCRICESIQHRCTEEEAGQGWNSALKRSGGLLTGLSPHIVAVDLPGRGRYYRLRVGPAGDKLCAALQAQGVDCIPARD